MTITLQTAMLGPVDVAVTPLVNAFAKGVYLRPQLVEFAQSLIRRTGQCGLRTSLIAAQIAHETNWFRYGGDVQPEQFNFAGLGATGAVAGASFASIDAGVMAVCEHHIAYIYGASAYSKVAGLGWPLTDLRMTLAARSPYGGKIAAIGDYVNGAWAVSRNIPIGSLANGYAASIVAIANTISTDVALPGVPTGGAMAVPWDRVHISADVGPARTLAEIKWFIVHDTEGHFSGDEIVLTSAAAPIESANVLVGREPGQCVLIVPFEQTAWAAGNDGVGAQALQVELSKAPNETGYTDYQYTKLAEVWRYAFSIGMVNVPAVYLGLHPADANGGPEPDDAGFIGHAGVPNPAGLSASPAWGGFGGHTDPGPDFDWPRLIGLCTGAAPSGPSSPALLNINGFDLYGASLKLWLATSLPYQTMGAPLGYEVNVEVEDPDGTVTERRGRKFECGWCLWKAGDNPDWEAVMAHDDQKVRELT